MTCLFLEILLFLLVSNGLALPSVNSADLTQWEKERLEWYWNLVGGQDQFEAEMENASQHASSLRNGLKCELVDFDYHGPALVGKLCFDDGICWAAKFVKNDDNSRELAIRIMESIENYCPDLLIPRFYESSTCTENETMCYYLMDWVEGRQLWYHPDFSEKTQNVVKNGKQTENIEIDVTLPAQLPSQLALFTHKLKTCPIPREQSNRLLRLN